MFILNINDTDIIIDHKDRNTFNNCKNNFRICSSFNNYKIALPSGTAKYGGFTDWFIEEFNKPSFTLECGLGENPLPFSDFNKIMPFFSF